MPNEGGLRVRETEARSPALARAPAIDAIEPLGEPRQVLGGDADAGVLDGEARAVRCRVPHDSNGPAFGRIANRVADQIAEGAGELLLAADEIQPGRRQDLDSMAS